MRPGRKIPYFLACLTALGGLAACNENQQPVGRTMPATTVSFVEMVPQRLPVVIELPGRIAPMTSAEVRPRVTGIILKRVFEQGSTVTQGDLLYVIDQEPFKARVRSSEAALASARGARTLAAQTADRQRELDSRNVTSRANVESAVAALIQAEADVDRAEADLRTAQLDLQYTEVRAPISGRVGRALITEGALVGPSTEPLAVISQLDPVYADFTQPADSLIRLKNALAEGQLEADGDSNAVMTLVSETGPTYPHGGKLLFSEAAVNSATGQVILRGEFPNPDMNLLPGMYVRGRITQASLDGALAVPKQAVQHDTAGKAQVFVVGPDEKVAAHPVTIGWGIEGKWVITSGLKARDRVIVEGFQRIAPGASVKAEAWKEPAPAPTALDRRD
ncbi:membrane fusion protein (multidrug efflux system) [Azospirillum brasilense]|uniref:Membrane fusion protein (Multidrug efflux system) n=2 Tax=Azospirillum brasilense TaxID=192 RepID=A0A560BC42_AZOBR|nr:membrane fusion protein (multidrug efflux system) [Azospirillum brasilense]